VACPDWIYANRNHVERLWARLKEWGAVGSDVGIDCGAFSSGVKVSAQAARSMG
jgi:hypothetical protein